MTVESAQSERGASMRQQLRSCVRRATY